MSRKCIDNEACLDIEDWPGWLGSVDHTYEVEPSVKSQGSFLQLGKLILQTQDGVIKKADFHKLEHWLLTDPRALEYYVQFMWLSAGLRAIFREKQFILT